MTKLSQKKCVPCSGDVPPLTLTRQAELLQQLAPQWVVKEGHHLKRGYSFPDFKEALAFTNRVGTLAEEEGHHPDISLGYGRVELSLYTHAINGLSESDFILAAKIDELKP